MELVNKAARSPKQIQMTEMQQRDIGALQLEVCTSRFGSSP